MPFVVCQGSVLGPQIYNVSINDHCNFIKHLSYLLFADNIKICCTLSSVTVHVYNHTKLTIKLKSLPVQGKLMQVITITKCETPTHSNRYLGGFLDSKFSPSTLHIFSVTQNIRTPAYTDLFLFCY